MMTIKSLVVRGVAGVLDVLAGICLIAASVAFLTMSPNPLMHPLADNSPYTQLLLSAFIGLCCGISAAKLTWKRSAWLPAVGLTISGMCFIFAMAGLADVIVLAGIIQ